MYFVKHIISCYANTVSGYEELELQGKRNGLHYSCQTTSCTAYQEHFWDLSGPAKEMKTPINTGKEIITPKTHNLPVRCFSHICKTKIFIAQVWMCDNVEMRICFLTPCESTNFLTWSCRSALMWNYSIAMVFCKKALQALRENQKYYARVCNTN